MSEIAEILFPIAERVIVTHADNPRSATTQEIRQALHVWLLKSVRRRMLPWRSIWPKTALAQAAW